MCRDGCSQGQKIAWNSLPMSTFIVLDSLYAHHQRYVHNISQTFTEGIMNVCGSKSGDTGPIGLRASDCTLHGAAAELVSGC